MYVHPVHQNVYMKKEGTKYSQVLYPSEAASKRLVKKHNKMCKYIMKPGVTRETNTGEVLREFPTLYKIYKVESMGSQRFIDRILYLVT